MRTASTSASSLAPAASGFSATPNNPLRPLMSRCQSDDRDRLAAGTARVRPRAAPAAIRIRRSSGDRAAAALRRSCASRAAHCRHLPADDQSEAEQVSRSPATWLCCRCRALNIPNARRVFRCCMQLTRRHTRGAENTAASPTFCPQLDGATRMGQCGEARHILHLERQRAGRFEP